MLLCCGTGVLTNTASHHPSPSPTAPAPPTPASPLMPEIQSMVCRLTYSGSLLHNNRHLTQGSPDFTDSKDREGKGGRKGGEELGRREKIDEKDRGRKNRELGEH